MSKEIDYSKIGMRIHSVRNKRGMTQEELANACGCTRNHLSNIEVGKSKPSLDLIIRIATVLDSTIDFFLLGTQHVSRRYLLQDQIGPKLDKCSMEELLYIEGPIDGFLRYKEAVATSK